MNKYIFATLLAVTISGCNSDYKLMDIREPTVATLSPDIEVDPLSHNFGALSSGSETQDISVKITNIGSGDLDLDSIYLNSGSSKFSLAHIPTGILEPFESAEMIVTYSPTTYELNSDIISIWSNDMDDPEVQVLLGGSGDAPIITIDPEEYDFGTVLIGCDDILKIKVGNAGNSNLIISDLEYFATIPDDFFLYDFSTTYGTLPIIIAPGDTMLLDVDYVPLDVYDDSAYVEITSNDPVRPVANSDHEGLGDYDSWIEDSFTQDGTIAADILFVIDNSGSMSSNQTNLKNNFDDFIAVFSSAGVDYQIALITTDSASFVGDIISPADADPITEFNDQVDIIGWSGSPYEKGLWYSYVATDAGGDAAPGSSTGFFRADSRLVIVYVSDEPDFSHSTSGHGGSTTMGTSDYSSHLLSLKSSSDLVAAHAVAGDHPSGCSGNGGAQFGDGYYDVVSDLGGTFMSICASDWSVTMDTLARDSVSVMSFPLSNTPIEDTITASVDGIPSTDWVYDSSANSITFTVSPADGSDVDIRYAIYAECN